MSTNKNYKKHETLTLKLAIIGISSYFIHALQKILKVIGNKYLKNHKEDHGLLN